MVLCLGHPAASTIATLLLPPWPPAFPHPSAVKPQLSTWAQLQEDHGQGEKPEGFACSKIAEMCVQGLVELGQGFFLAGNSTGCIATMMEQLKTVI